MNWRALFESRSLAVAVAILVVAILGVALHDPFDFDDRPHIEELLNLALTNVQGDTAVDMEERMWEQVKLGEAGNLFEMPEQEWQTMSRMFFSHNPGYVSFLLLDKSYNTKRTALVPEPRGLATTNFFADPRLQGMLYYAATSANRVAAAPVPLPDGNPGYLIAVPTFRDGEIVGFLVVIADIGKTLDAMLSEFKGLGYSLAVSDSSGQLYQRGSSEYRKDWGQSAKVPLPSVNWKVEVWPTAETVSQARSPLPEVGILVGLLLLLLLASTIHWARQSHVRSNLLLEAHDKLEYRVRERTAQLERVNEKLLHVQDEERRRIARELHDSTVQIMGTVAIDLERLQKLGAQGDPLRVQKLLTDSSELVERATTELRTISYLLHPPILDDLGLEGVLPWYAAGFTSRSGIKVSVKLPTNLGRLPHELELTFFRIVQEGLTNVHRHSGSPTAEIVMFRDSDRITLRVIDHGKGIPPGALERGGSSGAVIGVGIAGMRERVRQLGGQLDIESGVHGTCLTAVLNVACASV